ncbi:MAG TPA: glycosyltransferase family 9 protein [Pseudobdellovibrionaceae bacterium]|nr:glycosyltransferase family 9 protein [Pseudobdellovibrionaceae bacterium]
MISGGFVRRVAWVRVGALGDLVVGLAGLAECMQRFSDAELVVVGSKLWTEILHPAAWPGVVAIEVVDRRGGLAQRYEIEGDTWVSRGEPRALRSAWRDCDVVVDTRVDSLRFAVEAWRAGVPERWGMAPSWAAWLFTHAAPHFGKDPLLHERDVPLLILDAARRGWARFCPEGSAEFLSRSVKLSPGIARWRLLGLPAMRKLDHAIEAKLAVKKVGELQAYYVLNPTSSRREKAWPSAKFREFLLSRPADESWRVVGSPNESEWLREVALSEEQIVQPASIGELFEVLSRASGLLTNTSSMQFVAASAGCPVLTLMGRADPRIWGPVGPNDLFVRGREPRDVEDLFERERRAYDSIEVDEVLKTWGSLQKKALVHA